jgi:anti-anti-sigma factor
MHPQGTVEVDISPSNAMIVTLRGEHDLSTKPELATALVASNCPGVLVDLSDASFIDSSVINALLTAAARLRNAGGALELIIPPGAHPLRNVFRLMSLPTLLPVHGSREAALASLAARHGRQRPKSGVRLRALVQLIEESHAAGELRRKAA